MSLEKAIKEMRDFEEVNRIDRKNDLIESDIEHIIYKNRHALIGAIEETRKELQRRSFEREVVECQSDKLDAWKPYSDKFYNMTIGELRRILLKYGKDE